MKLLMQAMWNHFNTSNDLNTAVSGRMYPFYADQENAVFPYLTYSIITALNEYDFSDNTEDYTAQISIFSNKNSAVEALNIYEEVKSLFDHASLTMTGYRVLNCERSQHVQGHDALQKTWYIHADYDILIQRERT